jgi:hypothetical protein
MSIFPSVPRLRHVFGAFATFISKRMGNVHHSQDALQQTGKNQDNAAFELQRLNSIIQAAASTLDIQELTRMMLTSLHEILPFDYAGLELLNEDGETFTYFAPEIYVSEQTKKNYAAIPTVRLHSDPPDSLISTVFKEKKAIFLRRTRPEMLPPYQQAHFAITPWTSLLMLPMQTMGRVLGCVVFSGKQEFDIDEERIAFIERYVQQFTFAFVNARQFQDLQAAQKSIYHHLADVEKQKKRAEQAAFELEMVELFVRIINRENEFRPLLKTILYQLGYIVPTAEKGSVVVYQADSDDFRFIQVAGYSFEEFRSITLTRHDTLEQWIGQGRQMVEGVFIIHSFSRVGFESVEAPPLCALAIKLRGGKRIGRVAVFG